MKAFYVMFVVFVVLLFAAPMASAQDGQTVFDILKRAHAAEK